VVRLPNMRGVIMGLKRAAIVLLLVLIMFLRNGTGGLGEEGPPLRGTVCPEGPPRCDFAKIGDGIAALREYGILLVYLGTYRENLTL